jgi:catechol 2,3-dioxygenase-like lactoylglutathione lyase family enzyme
MIGYITIGAADIERAKTFYDSVLGTVGWKQFADTATRSATHRMKRVKARPSGSARRSMARRRAPATASWSVSMPKPKIRFTHFTTPR